LGAEVELLVGKYERFGQPFAEESCAAGNKQPCATKLFPDGACTLYDVFEIVAEQASRWVG
jgi:hypothetical protein